MSKKRTAEETRTVIFHSGGQILSTDGAGSLTLEAVAHEAGLSKGGLLYHFPTKEALIEGLFDYYLDKFEARMEQLLLDNGGDWLNAYMMASIEQITAPETAGVFAGLFAAGDAYPAVFDRMQQKYVQWQAQVEQAAADPAGATLIRLAVDGLWFSEMYQFGPPSAERRAQIVALINRMIQEM